MKKNDEKLKAQSDLFNEFVRYNNSKFSVYNRDYDYVMIVPSYNRNNHPYNLKDFKIRCDDGDFNYITIRILHQKVHGNNFRVSWYFPCTKTLFFNECPSFEEIDALYTKDFINKERNDKIAKLKKLSFLNSIANELDLTVSKQEKKNIFCKTKDGKDVRLTFNKDKNDNYTITLKTENFNGYFRKVTENNYKDYIPTFKDVLRF